MRTLPFAESKSADDTARFAAMRPDERIALCLELCDLVRVAFAVQIEKPGVGLLTLIASGKGQDLVLEDGIVVKSPAD